MECRKDIPNTVKRPDTMVGACRWYAAYCWHLLRQIDKLKITIGTLQDENDILRDCKLSGDRLGSYVIRSSTEGSKEALFAYYRDSDPANDCVLPTIYKRWSNARDQAEEFTRILLEKVGSTQTCEFTVSHDNLETTFTIVELTGDR